mmetsp:Transcript_70535/g.206425  ORF Transcript_70535/g.206425 Transcript_70535/m.206425 type:complete len:212 (+) Transcript_70535:3-638(+)
MLHVLLMSAHACFLHERVRKFASPSALVDPLLLRTELISSIVLGNDEEEGGQGGNHRHEDGQSAEEPSRERIPVVGPPAPTRPVRGLSVHIAGVVREGRSFANVSRLLAVVVVRFAPAASPAAGVEGTAVGAHAWRHWPAAALHAGRRRIWRVPRLLFVARHPVLLHHLRVDPAQPQARPVVLVHETQVSADVVQVVDEEEAQRVEEDVLG